MIKAVFDTNILVSGSIFQVGKPRRLIGYVLGGKIELISSEFIINEFRRIVAKEDFNRSEKEQERLIMFITGISNLVKVVSKFEVVKEDPDDDAIINTAYDGKAQ
jgi:putative PIN family toxin of toxin-antitoxin system